MENPSHPVWLPDRLWETSPQVELGASLKPGDSLAQRFLYLPKGNVIRVALSRPEEAFQAILAMARHKVDMDMGDALTHDVIESDERPIGPEALFNSPLQQLGVLKQRADQGSGQIGKPLEMFLWHEQAMAGEERSVIQKGQGEAVFKHKGGLFLPADDATERARCARV
jgi:hypothetical protein